MLFAPRRVKVWSSMRWFSFSLRLLWSPSWRCSVRPSATCSPTSWITS